MRSFVAFVIDGWRELLDKRSLQVLIVVAAVIVLALCSLSFEAPTVKDVLSDQAREINSFRHEIGFGGSFQSEMNLEYETGEVRAATGDDSLSIPTDNTWAVDLTLQQDLDLNAILLSWKSFQEFRRTRKWPAPPDEKESGEITSRFTDEDRERFLKERFEQFGYSKVEARRVSAEPPTFRVFVHSEYPHEIRGAKLGMLFGAKTFDLDYLSLAELLIAIQSGLANTFVGFIGMLLFVSVCAPFIPNFLQKGTLDLVLARPIGRYRLLLFKYFGAVVFVLAFTFVFITACWFVLSVRSGFWNPWFLLCTVTMTLLFAVIHSVSVLVGLQTRNSNLATIAALGIWFLSSTIGTLKHTAAQMFGDDLPRLKKALEAAYVVLPKVGDLSYLNTVFLSRSHLSPEAMERSIGNLLPDVDWTFSLSTTVAFTLAILALAAWRFHRKDY